MEPQDTSTGRYPRLVGPRPRSLSTTPHPAALHQSRSMQLPRKSIINSYLTFLTLSTLATSHPWDPSPWGPSPWQPVRATGRSRGWALLSRAAGNGNVGCCGGKEVSAEALAALDRVTNGIAKEQGALHAVQ